MSRWYANAEEYIGKYDQATNTIEVVAGPFTRNTPAIELIQRSYDHTKQVYGCWSRYALAKHKLFARTKAGDAALVAAVRFPQLAEQAVTLLGRQGSGLGSGYQNPDWQTLDPLLVEAGMLYAEPLPGGEYEAQANEYEHGGAYN